VTNVGSGPHAAQRLVADVQQFGLFSAAAVVDRYTALVDHATRQEPVIPGQDPGDLGAAALVDGAGRLVDTGLAVLDDLISVLARAVRPGPPAVPDELVLPAAAPGTCSEVSVWVHNPTASPVRQVRLRATSLVSTTGVIPADAVAFSPELLSVVEPGAAGELRLRVTVPEDQPTGAYQALVLSSVDGARGIALTLTVRPQAAAG
jgi:hypothetical protein